MRISLLWTTALACLVSGCGSKTDAPLVPKHQVGVIANPAIDEASGMQSGRVNPNALFLHNDDGPARLYVMDQEGQDLGSVLIAGASNRDWEDMTLVPAPNGPLLVVADTGDNFARREDVVLYFLAEPQPGPDGLYSGQVDPVHVVHLRYPDGARDCESVAFDAVANRFLFLTKRDKPPHLYSVGLDEAMGSEERELQFLGKTHAYRPPTAEDLSTFGPRDTPWVSQPTSLDISPDGTRAAVISYRSLYLFERKPDQDWLAALQSIPVEIEGPASLKEEAVTFTSDGRRVLVTTEGVPAPLYAFPVEPVR